MAKHPGSGHSAGSLGSSKRMPKAGSKVGSKFKTPGPRVRSAGTQPNTGFGSPNKRAIGKA